MSLLHESFHLVFCLPLQLFPGTGASNTLLSTCTSSLLLTCDNQVSLFYVIFFLTGATFTDPLTCSFLILSFFVTPHIHRSILISFTSSRLQYSNLGVFHACMFDIDACFPVVVFNINGWCIPTVTEHFAIIENKQVLI